MDLKSSCSLCFAGLSCQTRIKILNLIKKHGQMSVLEITKHFKVSQPTITHHLLYFKAIGILKSKKVGTKVYYFLDPKCKREDCGIFI